MTSRRAPWLALGLLLAVAVAVLLLRRRPDAPAPAAGSPATETATREPAAEPQSPEARAREGRHDSPLDPLAGIDDPTTPWSRVDLTKLRAELPDNVYWQMAVPTSDPEVLKWRQEERDRWNVEYGKVLSNTATPDEIDGYYAHRYRLSSDYIQFATYLLSDYGDDLPARDVALLKLAIEMHMARLEELPRQATEAHERAKAHDAARRAWLEEQKAFAPPAK